MVNWEEVRGASELAENLSTLERIGEEGRGIEGAGNIARALEKAGVTEGIAEKLQSFGKLSKVLKNGEGLKVAGQEDNCLSKILGEGRELRITGESGQETVNIISGGAIVEDESILNEIGNRMKKTLEGIDSLSDELKTIVNEGKEDAYPKQIAEISIRLEPDTLDLLRARKERTVLERMARWEREQQTFGETEANFIEELQAGDINVDDIPELMETMERINGQSQGVERAANSLNPEKLEELFQIEGLSIEQKQTLVDIFKTKSNLAIESTEAAEEKQNLQKGVMRMLNTHSDDLKTLFPSSGDSDSIAEMKKFLTTGEKDFKTMKKEEYDNLTPDEKEKFRAFQKYQENNAERRQLTKELTAENPPRGKNGRTRIFNKDGKFIGNEEDLQALRDRDVDLEIIKSAEEDLNIRKAELPELDEFKNLTEAVDAERNASRTRRVAAAAGAGVVGLSGFLGPAAGAVLGFLASAALNNATTLAAITAIVAFFSKCPEIIPVWLKQLIIYINDKFPETNLVIGDIANTFKNDPLVKSNALIIEAIIFCVYIVIILTLSWPNIFGTITFLILFTPIYALFFLGSAESIVSNGFGNLWDNIGVISGSTYTPGDNGISQDCFEYSFYLFIPTIIMLIIPIVLGFSVYIKYKTKKNHLSELRRKHLNASDVVIGKDYSEYYSKEMSEMMNEMVGGGINNFKSLFILKKFNQYLPYLLLIIMISIVILNKKYKNLSHKIM